MLAVVIVLFAILVLVMGVSLMTAGPSRVRRRVVYVPVRRRRRTVVEQVRRPAEPTETRRVVEYE